MSEPVDTASIVEVTEVTVREFRVKFSGADAYKGPVEVRAYGRLIGHWFPQGSLPSTVSPRTPPRAEDGNGELGHGLPGMRPGGYRRRKAPTPSPVASLSDRQRQRDEWLRKMTRNSTKGSGY